MLKRKVRTTEEILAGVTNQATELEARAVLDTEEAATIAGRIANLQTRQANLEASAEKATTSAANIRETYGV